MNPYVSVIIPVHNSEKYLGRCLDSILAQSYHDFELILVDDGSTDNSWDICRTYARKDDRIRTIRQSVNKGVSAARNAGLETADGKWIYFCDSDDYLFPDSLEILTGNIQNGADLILAGYVKVFPEENILHTDEYQGIIDREHAIEKFFETGRQRMQTFLWNRLFKKEIIDSHSIRFNESIHYKEDGLFIIQYMCRMSSSVLYVSRPVYNYVIHEGSAMGQASKCITPEFMTNLDSRIIILHEIQKFTGNRQIVTRAKEAVFNFSFWVYAIMRENEKIDYKLLTDCTIKTAKEIGFMSYCRFMLRKATDKFNNK